MIKIAELQKITGINDSYRIVDMLKANDKYRNNLKQNVVGIYSIEGDLNEISQYLLEANAELEALERAAQEEEKRMEQNTIIEQKRIEQESASVLITSGYSFEGYSITRYSGYISGDDCVTMPRDNFFGHNKVEENLCGALVKIRRQALKELKEAAVALNCNAVIGVDFDYLVMDPQHGALFNNQGTIYEPYVICVTANGNAVLIEKNSGLGALNQTSDPSNVASSAGMTAAMERELRRTEVDAIRDNNPKALVVDNMLVCQGCDFVMNNPDPDMKFCPQCGLEILRE